jgi:hypothetical protein
MRAKQIVLAFFNFKGLIYTNIVEALSNFMKVFKKNRLITAAEDWFLHWEDAPVYTAAIGWRQGESSYRILPLPTYSYSPR